MTAVPVGHGAVDHGVHRRSAASRTDQFAASLRSQNRCCVRMTSPADCSFARRTAHLNRSSIFHRRVPRSSSARWRRGTTWPARALSGRHANCAAIVSTAFSAAIARSSRRNCRTAFPRHWPLASESSRWSRPVIWGVVPNSKIHRQSEARPVCRRTGLRLGNDFQRGFQHRILARRHGSRHDGDVRRIVRQRASGRRVLFVLRRRRSIRLG